MWTLGNLDRKYGRTSEGNLHILAASILVSLSACFHDLLTASLFRFFPHPPGLSPRSEIWEIAEAEEWIAECFIHTEAMAQDTIAGNLELRLVGPEPRVHISRGAVGTGTKVPKNRRHSLCLSGRVREHTARDSSTDPPPSHNSENNNASELESDHQVDSDKDESDNDETYEQGGGEEAEGDQGENDGQEDEEDELEDDADLDPEIRTQAQNARAPAWQPWQDRLLIVQVNADRPFLAPRRSRTAAWDGTADALAVSSAQQGQNFIYSLRGDM
ncbi:hypothetical protein B0H14DRAFT_3546177 [Mycena olivaceomarginata]|nr:hypothetical protein B0H14DRAFT_3546177 [Mycena olivaceomarginata]